MDLTSLTKMELAKPKERQLRPQVLTATLRLMIKLYHGILPGDLDSRIAEQTNSCNMFQSNIGFDMLSVLCKYGPWRRSLYRAWLKAKSQPSCGENMDDLAHGATTTEAYNTLKEAVTLMEQCNLQVWSGNCGRQVSYCNGFVCP